jgi:enoyl-CoA hydratase
MDRALAAATELGAVAPKAFRLAKAQLRRPALERIAADAPLVDPEVLGVWSSAETTAAIRAQVERMTSRRSS